MDETNQTKDSLQEGKAPEGKEGTTPKVEAKTYSEEEKNEEVKKAVQNALIKAGRDNKTLELKGQVLTEREEAVKTAEAEVAELQEQLKNPDAVDWAKKNKELQEAQKNLRKEKAELTKKQAEFDSQIKVVQEETRDKAIWGIAAKFTNEPAEMADLFVSLSKLNIEDMGQLEELARTITSAKPKTPITPDSLITSGSVKSLKGDAALAEFFRDKK